MLIKKFIQANETGDIEDFLSPGEDNFLKLTIPCGVQVIDQQIQKYAQKQNIQEIIIPDSVIIIEDYSLQQLTFLLNIIIPESVSYIGQYAFYYDINLQAVIIPDSVQEIGKACFQYCTQIQFIRLSNQLKIIPEQAFNTGTQLQYLIIPKNIQTIQSLAFGTQLKLQCVEIQNINCQLQQEVFRNSNFSQIQSAENFNQSCYEIFKKCDDTYEYFAFNNHINYCREASTVQYYIMYQNDKIYIQNCSNNYYFKNYEPPYQCVEQCDGEEKYIIGKHCVNQCSGQYKYPYNGYQCLQHCKYYQIDNNSNQCVIDCPEQYPYYNEENQQCITNCQEAGFQYYKYFNNTKNSFVCLDQCYSTYYISGQLCDQQCAKNYSYPPSRSNFCSDTCTYYITSYVRFCTDDCDSMYSYQIPTVPKQCAQFCIKDSLYPFGYSGIYGQYLCIQNCQLYIDKPLFYVDNHNTYHCTNQCQDTFYLQDNMCTKQCRGQYATPLDPKDIVCDMFCLFYTTDEGYSFCTQKCTIEYPYLLDLDRQQCVYDCSQQDELKYKDNNLNPKQCVANCSIQNYYIQEYICQEKCDGIYAIPIDSNICDEKCQFYQLDDNTRKCIESCQEINRYSYKQNNTQQCVEFCPQYIQNYTCQDGCTDKYSQQLDQNNKTCVDDCLYYKKDNYNYCILNCSSLYKYLIVSENRCVKNCYYEEIFKYQNDHLEPKQCVQQCQEQYQYIQDQICQDHCNANFSINTDNNICVLDCKFYINEQNIQICTDICPEDYIFIVESQPIQCLKDCSTLNNDPQKCVQLCPEPYIYIQEGFCVQYCTGKYAVQFLDYNHTCDLECQYEIVDNANYCIDYCNFYLHCEVQEQRKICVESCLQVKVFIYQNIRQCVDKCKYFWYIDENEQNICTQEETCQANKTQNSTQIYIDQITRQCMTQCPNIYWFVDEKVNFYCTKEENCDDAQTESQQLHSYQYFNKQCISLFECQNNNFIYLDYQNSCVTFNNITNCSQIQQIEKYQNYQYYYKKQCLIQCEYNWYQYDQNTKICTKDNTCDEIFDSQQYQLDYCDQNNQQCVSECKHYWYQTIYNRKYCTNKDSCINQYSYNDKQYDKFEESTKQCVYQCQNKYWYYNISSYLHDVTNQTEKICSPQQNCQNVIVNEQYYDSVDIVQKQCILLNQCQQNENKYLFKDNICYLIKNILECYQLQDLQEFQNFTIQSLTLQECAQECQSQQVLYYQNQNQLTCINQCFEKYLTSIEISTNICYTLEECQKSYYINIHLMNTECQFYKNATSCNSYEQFSQSQKMINQFEDSFECTDCKISNYQVKNGSCVQITFYQSSQFTGILVGVIIGVVACIIVAILIIMRNKSLNSSQSSSKGSSSNSKKNKNKQSNGIRMTSISEITEENWDANEEQQEHNDSSINQVLSIRNFSQQNTTIDSKDMTVQMESEI